MSVMTVLSAGLVVLQNVIFVIVVHIVVNVLTVIVALSMETMALMI